MAEIKKGFYYHYKHNPNGELNNYAYEVLNIAHHTEIEDFEEAAMVIYRPLYQAKVYTAGKRWDARPYKMFIENVVKDSKEIPRFTYITDGEVTSKLEQIRDKMYE